MPCDLLLPDVSSMPTAVLIHWMDEVANVVTMLCSEASSARAQLDLLEQLTSATPDDTAAGKAPYCTCTQG
jgi:hypothetical protein